MNKEFKELAEGDTFTFNSIEYIKTATVKVSCCRSINAHTVGDEKNRTFLQPDTQVTVNN